MEKAQKNNVPMRMCVVCRKSRPKQELIRIVKCPDGQTVLDRTGKLNGRGTYVCPEDKCVQKALTARKLDRSMREALKENG